MNGGLNLGNFCEIEEFTLWAVLSTNNNRYQNGYKIKMEVDNFATISKIIKVFISDIYSSIIYSYSTKTAVMY